MDLGVKRGGTGGVGSELQAREQWCMHCDRDSMGRKPMILEEHWFEGKGRALNFGNDGAGKER